MCAALAKKGESLKGGKMTAQEILDAAMDAWVHFVAGTDMDRWRDGHVRSYLGFWCMVLDAAERYGPDAIEITELDPGDRVDREPLLWGLDAEQALQLEPWKVIR